MVTQNIWVVSLGGLVALALLVLSANQAVKRLIGIASYFNLSSTFMGMTIVSVATSIPEITAHLTASTNILRGTLDYEIGSSVVLGANIGSDVVQQTLIMGIVVFMAGQLYFRRYLLWKSIMPMIGAAILCNILGWDRVYSRLDGAILLGTFVAYNYFLYVDERKHYKQEDNVHDDEDVAEGVPQNGKEAIRDAVLSILFLTVTVISAGFVLSLTENIVQRTGIGGSLIGVVTLGVASALPELTTAIAGIGKKEHGISLGTLIGSNITNPLAAIGGGAILSTYWVPRPLVLWDLPWQAMTGAILWVILWFSKGKLNRYAAVYLMIFYVLYITLRATFFSVD